MTTTIHSFKAQPGPQTAFLSSGVGDILFGGARGGGKSYALLGHFPAKAAHNFAKHGKKGSFTGLLLRRTIGEFRQLRDEAMKMYAGVAVYEAGAKRFVFQDEIYGGAILYFGYHRHEKDSEQFQGLSLQWIGIDEAQNWPDPAPLDKLKATLRSVAGGSTYFVITANPGGKGHRWIKERYVDPSPPNKIFTVSQKVDGETFTTKRLYLRSLLSDNLALMANDPDYKLRLLEATLGNAQLARGWLLADWDIQAGGFFDNWSPEHHILPKFDIPHDWLVYRSYDWGSSAPFSIGWHAVSDGTNARMADGTTRNFSPGTIFRIAEWYGADPDTHKGLRMLERDIAQGVVDKESTFRFKVRNGPADTSIFVETNGRKISTEWEDAGIDWLHADKSPGSRVAGWQRMRALLSASLSSPQEHPGFFVFDTCEDFIRVIPAAQIDVSTPEDLDSSGEDHCLDECRYFLMTEIPAPFRLGVIKGF